MYEAAYSGARTRALVEMIRIETEALSRILPEAQERQWDASPVPRPREDTPQRTTGDRPSDPTADVALDPRRLRLRETVDRADSALYDAAVRLVAVRQAMERAIDRFDGEDT